MTTNRTSPSTPHVDKNFAAEFLGISVKSVVYLADKGRLASYKPAQKLLFRQEDLEAYRAASFRPAVEMPGGIHPKGWRPCAANRRDHQPCRAPAMRGKAFCLFHDPTRPPPSLPRPAPRPIGRPRKVRVETSAPACAPEGTDEVVR